MILITFKRWGYGPDYKTLKVFESCAVPRVGEEVQIGEGAYSVVKVVWMEDDDDSKELAVVVWVR